MRRKNKMQFVKMSIQVIDLANNSRISCHMGGKTFQNSDLENILKIE